MLKKRPDPFCSTASSTGSAGSPLASSLTVPQENPGPWACRRGPLPNRIFKPSLTHPALKDMSSFRGFCFFPCNSVAMLLLILGLPSVANTSASWSYFRVIPCSSVANASAYSSFYFHGKCLWLCLFLIPCLGFDWKAGMYGNWTHWELCSNPPMVLKTMANTSCANTPETNSIRHLYASRLLSIEKLCCPVLLPRTGNNGK